MTRAEILRHVDHTCLAPDATWADIRRLLDEAIDFKTASVCIPPIYVREAHEYAAGRMPICTVVGFPCGYMTTAVKAAEAAAALRDGADEIDMVIPVGRLKDRRFDEVREDIAALRAVTEGKILKVIIETCLLEEEEKVRMCEIVADTRADYIKTSTGFSRGGATREDIALFAAHCPPTLRIKAAGGIADFKDAVDLLHLGADRLGTSRLVRLAINEDTAQGGY